MCLAQGPQRSDACEARTRGPSVSSQALYHWAFGSLYMPTGNHKLALIDSVVNPDEGLWISPPPPPQARGYKTYKDGVLTWIYAYWKS